MESANDGKTLRIPIEAFKFPSNDEVEFTAMIKPCQKQCEPAQCIDDATQIIYNSYGRRRRRRDLSVISSTDTDMIAADRHGEDFGVASDFLGGNRASANLSLTDLVKKENRKDSNGHVAGKDSGDVEHERSGGSAVLVHQRINVNDIYSASSCLNGDCSSSTSAAAYQSFPG